MEDSKSTPHCEQIDISRNPKRMLFKLLLLNIWIIFIKFKNSNYLSSLLYCSFLAICFKILTQITCPKPCNNLNCIKEEDKKARIDQCVDKVYTRLNECCEHICDMMSLKNEGECLCLVLVLMAMIEYGSMLSTMTYLLISVNYAVLSKYTDFQNKACFMISGTGELLKNLMIDSIPKYEGDCSD